MSYFDEHILVASSPDAQLLLNTRDKYFIWTACTKAKLPKCRNLAVKEFKKSFKNHFSPVLGIRYSAYDPELSVSGQQVALLGER